MTPPAHSCDKEKQQQRSVTCKRCHVPGLAWHRCDATRVNTRQVWMLYTGHRTAASIVADTMQPHACTAPPPATPEPEQEPEPIDTETQPAAAPAPAPTPTPKPAPKPAPAPTPSAQNDDLARALAAAVEPYVAGKVDEARVREIVAEAVAAARDREPETRTIHVKAIRQDGTTATLGLAHEQLEQLVYLCRIAPRALRWPLLYGATGGGKSHAAHQAAQALGVPFYYVALTPGLPDSRLFGYLDATGTYRGTVLRQAYEHGGIICLDEIDNASDTTITGLNALLANGTGSFPDGMIERHPAFVLVATANTTLRGGSRNHAGRRALDGATLDRFAFLPWHYDAALEDARVQTVLPGATGRAWCAWVRTVRAYAAAHVPQLIVSQRAAYSGAVALAEGLPAGLGLDWLADVFVFAGVEPATRDAIMAACPLPKSIKVAA